MFRTIILPTALAILLPNCASGSTRMALEDALRGGLLALAVQAQDGPGGESVWVQVRNVSGSLVRTSIPAGWVFTSIDEGVQDLLVLREVPLDLAGGATSTVACQALCTQGALRAPEDGEPYRAGGMGSAGLVAVAEAIASGGHDESVAQSAIWVLSDGNSIASMGAMDSSATDTLRMVVSRLSGQAPPNYGMRYRPAGDDRMCSGIPETINKTFVLGTPAGALLSAIVVDRQGRVMHVIHRDAMLDPGWHQVRFEIPVLGWPSGDYAIHAWTRHEAGVHRLPFTL